MRAHEFISENFADGKGPGRAGDSQRHGIPKHATMAELEKASHAKGRKGQLARWQLNMRRGHNEEITDEGWKDWVAAGAIGAAALGGAANADAKAHAKMPVAKPVAAHTQQVKADPATDKKVAAITKSVNAPTDIVTNNLSKNTAEEHILQKVAIQSGIKGVELAQFMAQCAHESADFAHLKEIGGSLDFKKYDPRFAPKKAKVLGNTKAGDGAKFKGRGFIQITGRDNYRMAGSALGLPLEEKPELASNPAVAAKIAVWYWQTRVKPHVNNFNDTAAVTKKINPGMRGLEDRKENFKDYKDIMVAMR